MVSDNITEALRAVESGFIGHAHPFTWQRADEARQIDPRTLQRALQQDLIAVERNADRRARPVVLTDPGRARLGLGSFRASVSRLAPRET